MKIELGDEVKHKVSGQTGTVTSYCYTLAGPVRIEITPKVNANNEAAQQWFYLEELELVSKKA